MIRLRGFKFVVEKCKRSAKAGGESKTAKLLRTRGPRNLGQVPSHLLVAGFAFCQSFGTSSLCNELNG